LFSIQNAYSSAISALYGLKRKDPCPYTFRLFGPAHNKRVVFGPAQWGISVSEIENRMWLKSHGFDMNDIDRIEKILMLGSIRSDDKLFLSSMNRRLKEKQLPIDLETKKWCGLELKRISSIQGLDFAKSSNLIGALTLWHNIKYRIEEGSQFHDRWAYVSGKKTDGGARFVAEFLHWKLQREVADEDMQDIVKRYGIILDRVKF